MKRKLTLRTLLAAAMMMVGMNGAWAKDYYSTLTTDGVTTTEIHFNQYIYDAVSRTATQAFVLSTNSVTTVDSKSAYVVKDISGDRNLVMFNYLAMVNAYNMRHGSSTPIDAYASGGDGIYTVTTDQFISIVNLHPGDKVTIWHSGAVKFRSTNVTATVSDGDALTSATEYTIASGTQLDLEHYIKNKNHYIGVIKIVSQYDAISDPTLEQTAAGSTSTIRITAGKCNNSGSTVTTYYTLDGTTPSADHYEGSFTTATKDIDITSSKTIKAISITSGTYGGSSYVVSGDFVAEEAQLNAPIVNIANFNLSEGYYYPVYSFSSDQSDVVGYTDQTLTYTYSFNSATPVTAATYTATATAGTLRVTVSADGFESNYTDVAISGTQFVSTYFFDGADIADHATNTVAGNYSVNGGNCYHYQLTGMYINGLTVSGLAHAWAITANKSSGLSGRTGSGTVTYTGAFPAGSYILAYMPRDTNGSGGWKVSSTATINVPQYYAITSLRVLAPRGTAAYSLSKGTNLTQNGSFDSNVSGWNTVGTITKESDSSTSGSGFVWNASAWAEMWASNDSGSDDYAHYNADCYIAQRYANVPAGNYLVNADIVANGGNVSVYTISVNGVAQHTFNGPLESFTTKSYVINVPTDNSTITIKYAPQNGGRAWVGIDNVSCIYNYEASKTITIAGWATYCSPYALDLSSATGLTDAYIVTGGKNGVLAKIPVKGGTVPANTGLLLKGTEGSEVNVTIPVVASSETDVTANILDGVTANTEIAAKAGWVLMDDASNGLGFYQNTNAFTVGANTAYIPVADLAVPGAGARAFYSLFDNETTGVDAALVKNGIVNNEIFNLQGQRVGQPTKGLYIVGGRKVVKK